LNLYHSAIFAYRSNVVSVDMTLARDGASTDSINAGNGSVDVRSTRR
jgi:hypothetical protein